MMKTAFRKIVLAAGMVASMIAASTALAGRAGAEAFDLSPEQAGRAHAEKDDRIAAGIPSGFKFAREGYLTIAISPDGLPPIGSFATDAKTIIGFDPDIAYLVAEVLGKKLELVSVAWEDWPLGLSSGKYDAVINNVGVTEERKDKFDFSTYRKGVHGFYVKTGSSITSLKEPKDIAGLRIITDAGTIQEKIILEWDRLNTKQGLKPVEIIYFDDTAASSLALQSGRADTIFSMNAVQAYQAAVNGKTRLVGTVSAGWPLTAEVGITTRKGAGLADVFTAAINKLIADGEYRETLDRWQLTPEAIEKAATNPPGLPRI